MSYRAWLQTLANMFGNLSAAWLAAAWITPVLSSYTNPNTIFVLISNVLSGIVYLLIVVRLETLLEQYE